MTESKKEEKSLDEILNIIQESLVQKHPVQAWDILAGTLTLSNLELKALRKDRKNIELHPSTPADLVNLKKLVSGLGKINLFIGNENLVFKSDLKNLDDQGTLLVGLPEKWMIEERRDQERINTDGLASLHLKNKNMTSVLSINDISTTGLAIVMKKVDAKRYQKENLYPECFLEMLDKKIPVELKLERTTDFKHYEFQDYPYEVSVLGFSFHTPSDKVTNVIENCLEQLGLELKQIE